MASETVPHIPKAVFDAARGHTIDNSQGDIWYRLQKPLVNLFVA